MKQQTFDAARSTARIFGALAGLGGLVHGIGEVLQGNVKPDGLIIDSWAEGPIATNMGGEPGMTLVPNLRITGILTIAISLTLTAWALCTRDKKDGRTLVALAVVMLLTGGGFGPPIIGILAGIAGTRIGSPAPRWYRGLPDRAQRGLSALFPWLFGLAVANGVFLVIGSLILVYLFDVDKPDLFVSSFFFAVISLLLTVPLGRAYDSEILGQPAPA